MPSVAFDESGNTGQDLLNPAQPIFILASVKFSPAEERELLAIVQSNAAETKFKSLRKRNRGRKKLVQFLSSPLLTPDRAKVFVVDKSYMVTTKIVDLLIEPMAHRDGIDLYARGANIALANLLHAVTPVFCGSAPFERFQRTFVDMIRRTTKVSIHNFYQSVVDLHASCSDAEFRPQFEMILNTAAIAADVLPDSDTDAIDPAWPVLVSLIDEWGKQLGERFTMIHDQSKPITNMRRLLQSLTDPRMADRMIGCGRRAATLPLKIASVALVDSKLYPQVMLADLLAGAFAYSAKRADENDEVRQAAKASCTPLLVGGLWPTTDVTPEALDTEEVGHNLVDGVNDFLAKQRALGI